jgi:hypothetical protein
VRAAPQDFFSHDPSADAINRTRNAVADVKNIMVENIEKVLHMSCASARSTHWVM